VNLVKNSKQTVFVGLSGGVDSSVAALRLKKAGYRVVGVFIKVWHPDFLVCDWEAERLDAMRVAAHLDIPFLTCDAVDSYKKEVADYFISEYKAGRTPNPDVFCNKAVKFGAFLNFALEKGADFIATGHYARRSESNDLVKLFRGVDNSKDQSYFLWTLTQEQLQKVLLPVGNSSKQNIRKEAAQAKLPTAIKKDSQGICFLGHIDIPEFLGHFIDLKPGKVIDVNGKIVGEHKGALVYTLGQRHGFTFNSSDTDRKPHYVVDRDLNKNLLIVDVEPPLVKKCTLVKIANLNWITMAPKIGDVLTAQFYYQQTAVEVVVEDCNNQDCSLRVNKSSKQPASGQSCVLYKKEECLGGGIIT